MGLNCKYRLIGFIVLILVGCDRKESTFYNDGSTKSTFYLDSKGNKDGEQKTFYATGELMSVSKYQNGKLIDSVIRYNRDGSLMSILKNINDSIYLREFKNGILISEGRVDSVSRPIGWWNIYDGKKIKFKQERIIINNVSVINQQNIFEDGKVDVHKSFGYQLIKPDLIKVGKQYPFKIKFHFNESNVDRNLLDKVYYYLLISPEINEDFSNLKSIDLDTLVPINKNEFIYNLGFKKSGEKKFRAIIEKHTLNEENKKLFIKKTRIFITQSFHVDR